jgi:hypothetical protein
MEKLKLVVPSNRNNGSEPNIENQKSNISPQLLAQRIKVQQATFAALARYTPTHFPGRLCLLLPCKAWARSSRQPLRWRTVAERVEEYYGPDDCHTDVMLLEPNASIFAQLLRQSVMGEA